MFLMIVVQPHILLTSKEKFNNFNHSLNPQSHIVQLADGSKAKSVKSTTNSVKVMILN